MGIIATPKQNIGYPKTLGYIVNSVLNRTGNYDDRKYVRYLQFAIDSLREINILHSDMGIQVAYLDMSDTRTIDYPQDYVKYTKVGILIGNRVWTLSVNDDIALPREEECGLPINDWPNVPDAILPTLGGYRFAPHWRLNSYVGGLYGIGGGVNIGYFREDTQRRQFVFSNSIPGKQIVLEYISNGISGATVVPDQWVNAIIQGVLFYDVDADMNINNSVKQYRMARYYEEIDKARTFEFSPTIEELSDIFLGALSQSYKR